VKDNVNQMEKEEISVLSNIVMAFSGWVGVGSALAVYLNQLQSASTTTIILVEIIYILTTLLVINWIKGKLE
jgi:hypothetical protein